MLLDTDRDKNIDLIREKMYIFCRTHIAVGHRIQGGRPGPLRLPSAAGSGSRNRYPPLRENISSPSNLPVVSIVAIHKGI